MGEYMNANMGFDVAHLTNADDGTQPGSTSESATHQLIDVRGAAELMLRPRTAGYSFILLRHLIAQDSPVLGSPYNPGAGHTPEVLAGRETLIASWEAMLTALSTRLIQSSLMP